MAEWAGVPLLYLLANDSIESSKSKTIDVYTPQASKFGNSLEEQFAYFYSLDTWISSNLKDCIWREHLSNYSRYFETDRFDLWNRMFINEAGKEKLKREWPNIWQEFDFEGDA